ADREYGVQTGSEREKRLAGNLRALLIVLPRTAMLQCPKKKATFRRDATCKPTLSKRLPIFASTAAPWNLPDCTPRWARNQQLKKRANRSRRFRIPTVAGRFASRKDNRAVWRPPIIPSPGWPNWVCGRARWHSAD